MGLECDREGQVPAGSERGRYPQHPPVHLLDIVSSTSFVCSVLSAPLTLLPAFNPAVPTLI